MLSAIKRFMNTHSTIRSGLDILGMFFTVLTFVAAVIGAPVGLTALGWHLFNFWGAFAGLLLGISVCITFLVLLEEAK